MDVHTPERRSHNMSRIRGQDTKPELILRRALHARGLRFRLHPRDLPGTPDLVFRRRRAAVFVHGCFWHGHDCPMFRLPATRTEFWRAKIDRSIERDHNAANTLRGLGWRRLVVWECAMRGRAKLAIDSIASTASEFILGDRDAEEISGDWASADRTALRGATA